MVVLTHFSLSLSVLYDRHAITMFPSYNFRNFKLRKLKNFFVLKKTFELLIADAFMKMNGGTLK